MNRRATWIAAALAAAAVAIIVGVSARSWIDIGDAGISAAGWGAIVLAIVFTLALGIGLMALVFISSRRGYDETDRRHR